MCPPLSTPYTACTWSTTIRAVHGLFHHGGYAGTSLLLGILSILSGRCSPAPPPVPCRGISSGQGQQSQLTLVQITLVTASAAPCAGADFHFNLPRTERLFTFRPGSQRDSPRPTHACAHGPRTIQKAVIHKTPAIRAVRRLAAGFNRDLQPGGPVRKSQRPSGG